MNNTAAINGLLDGISILEHNNGNELPAHHSDMLYNDNEPVDFELKVMYYDEGFTVSDYRTEDSGEPVTLLSTISLKEALLGTDDTI